MKYEYDALGVRTGIEIDASVFNDEEKLAFLRYCDDNHIEVGQGVINLLEEESSPDLVLYIIHSPYRPNRFVGWSRVAPHQRLSVLEPKRYKKMNAVFHRRVVMDLEEQEPTVTLGGETYTLSFIKEELERQDVKVDFK